MEMLIDIPEELYKYVRGELAESECPYDYNLTSWNAIHNGTPLPKEHGRLIDVDKLLNDGRIDIWTDYGVESRISPIDIESAPIIIEAKSEDK